MQDDDLINEIHDRMGSLDVHRGYLLDQVADVERALKRYERALKALGDPAYATEPKQVKPNTHAAQRSAQQKASAMKSMARSDTWPHLREAIIAYAHEHEEFRQVDFRDGYDITSSKSSTAFNLLREENVLRISRVDGNSKFYRLTKEALDAN